MITIEDYQFHYDLYLAETELYTSIIQIGGICVNESVGLISLNEGVKETITNYLTKVWEAIQNAFKKFVTSITNEADKLYLKSIADKMQNPNPDFVATNFTEYDFNKMDQLKVTPFNYEQMKEDLENKDVYLSKYHNYLPNEEGSISDKIAKHVVSKVSDKKIDASTLKDMYKSCISDFPQKIKKIEDEIKHLETSKKNIESVMNSIPADQTTTEAVLLFESYLVEADEKKEAMGFKDGDNGPNPDNNQSGQGKTKIVQHITNYMKIETDILSGKLKAYRDCYNSYMKCIKHYIKPEKSEKDEEKK